MKHTIKDILFGLAVGDALGVPVEFMSREDISKNPVTEMREFGTHHQPMGTWSDDASLAFCLAESLTKGYDVQDIADNFVKWKYKNLWTARGEVFDIGIATSSAIDRIANNKNPIECGGADVSSNGNGSLMRILPLLFEIKDYGLNERFKIISDVSSITHRHPISIISCFYYMEYAKCLVAGFDRFEAYHLLRKIFIPIAETLGFTDDVVYYLSRLTEENIFDVPMDKIHSSGFVVHSLEASIYNILTTNSYEEAVLQAVNMGQDTDTTAAITGGLAGLIYGVDSIPKEWINVLARKEDISDLADRYEIKNKKDE